MPIPEQYSEFRKSHAISRLTVSGSDWSFIDSGTGRRTVVILPGGGGVDADCMFPVVLALERQYRVIAIGYPPTATTVKELTEGVRAILDDRGVGHCCMLGHSLGGFLGRAFAQACARRADSLIIANSAVYTPGRALLIRIVLTVSLALPRSVLVSAMRSKFLGLLRTLPGPDRKFWMSYMEQSETMDPKSNGLRNQLRCMSDFVRLGWCKPVATTGWSGPVLIIEASDETGFTLKERRIFRTLYPGANVHIIEHAGHGSFITNTREFNETAGDFLAGLRG
jgi:pimeloyl-ACP methyl ester carboxylesterase